MNPKASKEDESLHESGRSEELSPAERQMNEKALFIFHKSSGVAMYSHYFILNAIDPQLLAGFVGAMASFLSEFVGFERSHWKTIYGTDATLVVETGEWAVGVLAVSRETSGLRKKLRIILSEFEVTFGALRDSFGFEGRILASFDEFAMRVFTEDIITPRSLVRRSMGWDCILPDFEGINELKEMNRFLHSIETGSALGLIAEQLGKPFREVKEMASVASWDGAIDVDYIPAADDILIPSERSLGIVFSNVDLFGISATTIEAIGKLDGRCSVCDLIESFNERMKQEVLGELGLLMRLGYIQSVTPEHRLVIDQERVVNRYLSETQSVVPDSISVMELQRILRSGLLIHPWLSRINMLLDGTVQCRLDSNMSHLEFEAMFDALQYLINKISTSISARVGSMKANAALFKARITAKRD
ncbi:MAG: hypothetical protein ACFFFC_15390 [Candidatus Thorarchaeota archaeon]